MSASSLLRRVMCLLGQHTKIYMSFEQVERERWISGACHPWRCKHCGIKSWRAKWPLPPKPEGWKSK